MIKELVINEEKNILKKLNEYEMAKKECERLKEREEQLNEIIKETNPLNIHYPTPVVEQKFNIFQRMFSRKYKEYIKKIEEYEDKVKVVREEIEKNNQENIEAKEELEKVKLKITKYENIMSQINIEELNQRFIDLKDERKAIRVLLELHPNLSENVEFMKEAVEIDINNIQYDRTNDLNLYLNLLEHLKKDSKLKGKFEKSGRSLEDYIGEIQKELIDPKKVEQGKYKIPIKYLYEAIRMDIPELETEQSLLFGNVNKYNNEDGKHPKEIGEKIQQLYEDEGNYLLVHRIFYTSGGALAKVICSEGLKCCMHDEWSINNLKRTTWGTYQKGTCFSDFLRDSGEDKILISIPKKTLDENECIWGSDSKKITTRNGAAGYVLPQYIVGFVNAADNTFVENQIPVQERKKYRYRFRNGETISSIEEREVAD